MSLLSYEDWYDKNIDKIMEEAQKWLDNAPVCINTDLIALDDLVDAVKEYERYYSDYADYKYEQIKDERCR